MLIKKPERKKINYTKWRKDIVVRNCFTNHSRFDNYKPGIPLRHPLRNILILNQSLKITNRKAEGLSKMSGSRSISSKAIKELVWVEMISPAFFNS